MREHFSFYRSFLEAIDKLPPDIQAEIYPAIAHYALNDATPTGLSPFAECVFTLVKPIIDSNNKKRDNGAKGGAPTGNKNARKKTTKNNQKQPTVVFSAQPKNNQKQPNNVNDYNNISSPNGESNYSNINYKDDENKNISIINNKDAFGDVDAAAERFCFEIFKKEFVESATKALSISEKEFTTHARAIIAEWRIANMQNFLPENTPQSHLLNQIRIKRDCINETKAQASFAERELKQQRKQAEAIKAEQERNEPRGYAALAELRRKHGLSDTDSTLSMLSKPTEAEALTEFKSLNTIPS